MKKIALLILTLVGTLLMHAEEKYSYLTFEMTDGKKVSVNTESLKLSVNGTTLTAGTQSFTLTNLSKMYFSTSDESNTSDIEEVSSATLDDAIEICDLQGHQVTKAQMRKGVYIVKTKEKTCKIVVK
ncbi:MAG: hypothetical protein J5888_04215 [Bacteroidaceae bacterium]|nr:hypothetical protein [Bacteroidaceae bacterium]